MDKYINATNLIKNIDAALAKSPPRGNGKSTGDVVIRAALGVTKQMVQDELKTGEVRPVVHAHWIKNAWGSHCSICDYCDSEWTNFKFCPFCGATMDEPEVNK